MEASVPVAVGLAVRITSVIPYASLQMTRGVECNVMQISGEEAYMLKEQHLVPVAGIAGQDTDLFPMWSSSCFHLQENERHLDSWC